MPETHQERFTRWGLQELLRRYPGLRLRPTRTGSVILTGPLAFVADGPTGERITDEYKVRISVPRAFPAAIPSVWETGGRIRKKYHTLTDDSLCLGSPTRIRLQLYHAPSLQGFVETCIIPYLYGRSYFERYGTMPFGELDHGAKGLRQDLVALFGTKHETDADGFVRLAAMRKRLANKKPCPCRSGHRLGRCHHRIVNRLREQLGRSWFCHVKNTLETMR